MKNLQVIYHTRNGVIKDHGTFSSYDSIFELHSEVINFMALNNKNENPVICYDDENMNLKYIPQKDIISIEVIEVD